MFTFHHVLFPVDFSSGCQVLAPTVRRMVEVWSVDVTLLHAIDEERWLGGRHELQRLMRQMKAIAGDGPQARYFGYRLERGQPAVRILEYIRAHPIDLVVIPAGGTSRPVGSVADQVLAEASCPVWLDWGVVRCRATTGMDARRVCCALELGECDETVLATAAKMAAELGATLSLIHALPPTGGKPPGYLWDAGIREREVAAAVRRLDGLRHRFSPPAEAIVEVGQSSEVVGRALQSRDAGLLVTGNCLEAILAAQFECPVLRLAPPASAAVAAAEGERLHAGARRSA